jgi:hypothetical protein
VNVHSLTRAIKYAYFSYVVYGDIDQSGLPGWISALSMGLLHASWDIPNVLVGCALYFPVAGLMRRALRFHRTPPSPARAAKPDASHPTATPVIRNRSPAARRALAVVILVAALLGAVAPFAAAVVYSARALAQRRLAQASPLDLDNFSGVPPSSPRVSLSGRLQLPLTARFEAVWAPARVTARSAGGTRRRETALTPMTSESWRPGQPVSVVFEDVGSDEVVLDSWLIGRALRWIPHADPASLGGGMTEQPTPGRSKATLNVRLRANALPLFVKDGYERAGLHFADPYWVADGGDDARPFLFSLLGATVAAALVLMLAAKVWRNAH